MFAWGNDLDLEEEDPFCLEDLVSTNAENTGATEQDTFHIERVDKDTMEFFIVVAKLLEMSGNVEKDLVVTQILDTRLKEIQKDFGMKGLLDFEGMINYVQFEKLRDYFLNFLEKSVIEIIEHVSTEKGPLTNRVDTVRSLENLFFDREIVTSGGIWDSDYQPGNLHGICEKLCEERWVIDGDCVPKGRLLNDYFFRTKVDKSGLMEELKHEGFEL